MFGVAIRYSLFVILLAGILHGTGWKPAAIDRETVLKDALWSKVLSKSGIPSDAHEGVYKDAVFRDEFIGVQINESYYGFEQTNRFFESPVIEKIGLGFAAGALIVAAGGLIINMISRISFRAEAAGDKLNERSLAEDGEDERED